MEALFQDLRYALRMVAKSPGTTAIALLTIGIATGANATVFGFVSALLLRPAPGVADPGAVVSVYTGDYSSGPYGSSSYPDFLTIRSEIPAFVQVAAQEDDSSGIVEVGARVERVPVASVTGDYFPLLGVRPALGRVLTQADAEPGAPPAVVVSYGFWGRTLGADPTIVGTALTTNDRVRTIVGVLPEGFAGLDLGQPIDVWVPLAPATAADARENRSLAIVARLRDRISLVEAQAQVSALATRLALEYPETNRGTLAAPDAARPMTALRHSRLPPDFRPMVAAVSAILMAAVGLVLVIACANVAGLLISRAIARDREMAVRRALGAGRPRIVRQLLTESLLLGIGGGISGLLLALWTSDILPSFFPAEQAQLLDTSVDVRTIAFIAAISIGSSLLFGLAPALHASGAAASQALRAGAARGSGGHAGARLRRLLVGAQVAAAVVLLVSSGLLVRSLSNALAADLGFGTREGVVATVELPPGLRESQGWQFYGRVLEQVRGLSGVRGAAFVRTLPLSRAARRGFQIEGYDAKPGEDMELVINVVSGGYFETMQIPVRSGRTFDARDGAAGAPVVIVNDLLANRFFAGDALGRRLTDSAGRVMEIVGVVQSHKYLTVQDPPVATVYYPLDQEYRSRMTLAVRTDRSPRGMIEPIARAIAAVDPRVPLFRTMLLSAHLEESTAADRLTTSLVALCGGMALLLATLGVYGVIAYAVVRRAREIGIRVALGARPPDVVRLILGEGLRVTGVGVVLGLVAAALTARVLGSLMPLYGVEATDPLTYAAVPALLFTVALVAVLPPTRRALRLDPNVVLRQE